MDGCLGVICFVESFPMLTYILDPNLNGCKAAQNGICLIPVAVFFSLLCKIVFVSHDELFRNIHNDALHMRRSDTHI